MSRSEQRGNFADFSKLQYSIRDVTKEYILVIAGTATAIVLQRCDSPNLSPPPLSDSQVVEYTADHRISIQQEGKRGGGRFFFTRIEPNWPLPYSRDAVPACSMPRAQNRRAEGAILLWRRSGYSLSMTPTPCPRGHQLCQHRVRVVNDYADIVSV